MRLLHVLAAHAGDAFADDALDALRAELEASAVWVHLVDPAGTLHLAGARGLPAETTSRVRTLSPDAPELAARTFRTGRPGELTAASAGEAASTDKALLQAADAHLRALPLRARGKTLGVLSYTSTAVTGGRDEDIVALLSLAIAGLEAHRARTGFFNQIELAAKATRELSEYLTRIPETVQGGVREAEISGYDPKPFFNLLAERARELVGAELAAVGVGNDPDKPFDPWVAVGVAEEVVRAIGRIPRPVATLGLVARGGETLRLRELATHPAFVGLPAHHPEIRCLLAVPIRFRGEAMGTLYVANKTRGEEFTVEDQRAIELLAAYAAMPMFARERAALDRHILDAAPDGVLFVDASSGQLLANQACETLFGQAMDPARGTRQFIGRICWPDGRPLTEDELPSARVLRGEPLVEIELVVARPDGRRIPVVGRASPVHDQRGGVVGVVVIYRDVSAQKEVERLREEFAGMVAHDLRNPIQSILLQIDMLRRAVEEGKAPAPVAFDRLRRSGARLAQMASELLDSTRIELSRTRLGTVRLDVPQAVESIVERVRPTLGEHRLTFEVHGRPPASLVDPVRLDQILTNLLDNAAKYSAEGTTIRVWVAEAEGGVEIGVKDEGVGIAPDDIPKLFDRFYQTRRAREKKTGLGLGLYITKGLVDAHGGRIDVESTPGRGSAFRVWLPAAPPAEEAAPSPSP